MLAGEYYRAKGTPGLVSDGEFPHMGDPRHGGYVAYHVREGSHFLSREDWNYFIQYLNAQK